MNTHRYLRSPPILAGKRGLPLLHAPPQPPPPFFAALLGSTLFLSSIISPYSLPFLCLPSFLISSRSFPFHLQSLPFPYVLLFRSFSLSSLSLSRNRLPPLFLSVFSPIIYSQSPFIRISHPHLYLVPFLSPTSSPPPPPPLHLPLPRVMRHRPETQYCSLMVTVAMSPS